ncbi:MAG: hypothetical protein R3F05_11745 [Planctomycetota bacterium]
MARREHRLVAQVAGQARASAQRPREADVQHRQEHERGERGAPDRQPRGMVAGEQAEGEHPTRQGQGAGEPAQCQCLPRSLPHHGVGRDGRSAAQQQDCQGGAGSEQRAAAGHGTAQEQHPEHDVQQGL